jgi:curved DNA-binding protein CbpA
MSDPYEILGVTPQADEAEIRRRYLALVREFPPERAPERFAAIRVAYDEVRNPARRLSAQLFEPSTSDTLDALVADLRDRLSKARLSPDVLLSLAEAP